MATNTAGQVYDVEEFELKRLFMSTSAQYPAVAGRYNDFKAEFEKIVASIRIEVQKAPEGQDIADQTYRLGAIAILELRCKQGNLELLK